MDRIRLRNMRLFTHVGCTSDERRVGQHLEMDLEFRLDLREAGGTDRIGSTVDYADAYTRVQKAVDGLEANLLETVAERAAHVLLEMDVVEEVVVRVRKPTPPIPGSYADHAEVEIRRARGSRQGGTPP